MNGRGYMYPSVILPRAYSRPESISYLYHVGLHGNRYRPESELSTADSGLLILNPRIFLNVPSNFKAS